MKRLAIIVLGVLAMGISAPPARAEVSVNVTIGRFYDELAPYGRWVKCRYGRCWVPRRVARRWQPYTNGRWVYTEYGWTWVSRDPWGGSPYHYGTWVYLSGYGWSWVPGTVWAPAWVTWSYSDRYVGWAPLPPSFACGDSGYSGRPVVVSQTQYVFVPTNRFVDTDITAAWLPATQSATIFRQTRPVTNFGVSDGIVRNTGIPIATIQGATGGRIETRSIGSANTAPQAIAAGGNGKGRRVAVVAPAREVNAAMSARPQEPSRPAPPSRPQEAGRAQAGHGSKSVRPESRPEVAPPREAAKPEHREPKAARSQEQPPPQSHDRAARPAPAEHRQQPPPQPQDRAARPAPAEHRQQPPPQPHDQAARPAPAEHRQQPPPQPHGQEARPAPAEHHHEPAPKPKAEAAPPPPAPPAQAAPPKQEPPKEKPAKGEKPPKKEKEKDQKDEKH